MTCGLREGYTISKSDIDQYLSLKCYALSLLWDGVHSEKERTKVGIQRAEVEGKHCGRPFKDIDWKYVDHLHETGMNYKEIAERIKMPYVTLMRRKNNKII